MRQRADVPRKKGLKPLRAYRDADYKLPLPDPSKVGDVMKCPVVLRRDASRSSEALHVRQRASFLER